MHKYILVSIFCLFFLRGGAEETDAGITESLVRMGMEEVRVKATEDGLHIAYEDNVYRGTYRGLGAVIRMLLEDEEVDSSVHLVVLAERVPQIAVCISQEAVSDYRDGRMTWRQLIGQMGISYDTAADTQPLKGEKAANRSAGKVDIVLYPEVTLNNAWMDKLYGTILNLSPAVEVALWRGASFTGQVIFPVWNNMKGEMDYIRPGILAVRQELRLPQNWFATVNVGNFDSDRMGAKVSLLHRTNNDRWAAGVDAALTGSSTFYGGKWELSKWKKLSGSAFVCYNEPHYGLEVELRAMRFVYGDYGVRLDCTRHFGEVSVGLYAMCAGGLANGGFHFAIPLPRRKRTNRHAVRIRLPEYFDWEYAAQSGNEYVARRLGHTFETRPDENRSRAYYNPDFIRKNLMELVILK